jgi:hypothetical protein
MNPGIVKGVNPYRMVHCVIGAPLCLPRDIARQPTRLTCLLTTCSNLSVASLHPTPCHFPFITSIYLIYSSSHIIQSRVHIHCSNSRIALHYHLTFVPYLESINHSLRHDNRARVVTTLQHYFPVACQVITPLRDLNYLPIGLTNLSSTQDDRTRTKSHTYTPRQVPLTPFVTRLWHARS